MHKNLFAIGIIVLLFHSCEIINPEEDIPSYIYVEEIKFTSTNPDQGSSSNKILDAWVYVDDELIGAFDHSGYHQKLLVHTYVEKPNLVQRIDLLVG